MKPTSNPAEPPCDDSLCPPATLPEMIEQIERLEKYFASPDGRCLYCGLRIRDVALRDRPRWADDDGGENCPERTSRVGPLPHVLAEANPVPEASPSANLGKGPEWNKAEESKLGLVRASNGLDYVDSRDYYRVEAENASLREQLMRARTCAEETATQQPFLCEDCEWHGCSGKDGGCGCKCHRPRAMYDRIDALEKENAALARARKCAEETAREARTRALEAESALRQERGLKALLANGMPPTGDSDFDEVLATHPIAAMIQRGWLSGVTGFDDLPALEAAICKFYEVSTIAEAVNPSWPRTLEGK